MANDSAAATNAISIAIADRFHAEALASLKTNPALNVVGFDESTLPELQGLIVRSQTRIDSAFLAKAPKLKALVTATVGFDHLDIKACTARGVRIAPVSYTHLARSVSKSASRVASTFFGDQTFACSA